MAKKTQIAKIEKNAEPYEGFVAGIAELLEQSRRTTARATNSVLTATYWEIGCRIVEFEQGGETRAEYGAELIDRLGVDLGKRFGRGFSARSLRKMRSFFVGWEICQTAPGKLNAQVRLGTKSVGNDAKLQTTSAISEIWPTLSAKLESPPEHARHANIPPTVSAKSEIAQTLFAQFGSSLVTAFPLSWSQYVRLMSVEKAHARAFYESEAIRIGTEWYRIDLLLYHRRLRCLVVLDLKIGKYTHADAGQMSLYLTYAREHLLEPGENEPVGIILCSDKDDAVVHYSMGSINARVFASKYMTELPDVETLQREIEATKLALVHRQTTNEPKTNTSTKRKR